MKRFVTNSNKIFESHGLAIQLASLSNYIIASFCIQVGVCGGSMASFLRLSPGPGPALSSTEATAVHCVSVERKKMKPQICHHPTMGLGFSLVYPVEQQLLELKPTGLNIGNTKHFFPGLA